MRPLKEKLLEMFNKDFTKDEQHQLTMELFGHHTYTKEKAFIEGYKSAVAEVLDNYHPTPVKEFHEKFGHPVELAPAVPPLDTRILRVKLLLEEVLEFALASGVQVTCYLEEFSTVLTDGGATFILEEGFSDEPNLVEAADALGDIRYVTDGANLVWGFPQEEILYEIHSSNMSKLGEDGKPIYREDGKIRKGPNTRLPDIAKIFKEKESGGQS